MYKWSEVGDGAAMFNVDERTVNSINTETCSKVMCWRCYNEVCISMLHGTRDQCGIKMTHSYIRIVIFQRTDLDFN